MPGYKTHVVGGMATFVGLVYVIQRVSCFPAAYLTALSCFFVTILGSLFPDVDTKSKGQMIFYQMLVCYLLFLLWASKFTLFMISTCLIMVPLLVPHRGLFHNFSFLLSIWIIVSCAAIICMPLKATDCILHVSFFTAGAFSHVILDRLQTALKFL